MQPSSFCAHRHSQGFQGDLLLQRVESLKSQQPSLISVTDAEIQEIYKAIKWQYFSLAKCVSCMSDEELMRCTRRRFCVILEDKLAKHPLALSREGWALLDRCKERLQELISDDEKMVDPYIQKYLGSSASPYVITNLNELTSRVKSLTKLNCLKLRALIQEDLNNEALTSQSKEILKEVLGYIYESLESSLRHSLERLQKLAIVPQIHQERSLNEIVEIVTEQFYALITSGNWTADDCVVYYLDLGVDLTKRRFVHFVVKNMEPEIACRFIQNLISRKLVPHNVDEEDEDNKTVLDYAIDKGYDSIVENLKGHARRVNAHRYQLNLARQLDRCSNLFQMDKLIKRALDLQTPLDISSICVTSNFRRISLLSYACSSLTSSLTDGFWTFMNTAAWDIHAEFASGILDLYQPNEANQVVRDEALSRSLHCYSKPYYVRDRTCELTLKLLEKNASLEQCLNEACYAILLLLKSKFQVVDRDRPYLKKELLDALLLSLVSKTILKQNEHIANNKEVFPLLVYLFEKLPQKDIIAFIDWTFQHQIPIDYNQAKGASLVKGKRSPLDAAIGAAYGVDAKKLYPTFFQLIIALCKKGASALYHPNRYRSFLEAYLQTASNCNEMHQVIENLLNFFREVKTTPQLVLPLTELNIKIGKNTIHNLLTWTLGQIKAKDKDASRFCKFLSEQPEFTQEALSKPFIKDQFARAWTLLHLDTAIN